MLKNYVVSTFAIVLRTNVNKQKKKKILADLNIV